MQNPANAKFEKLLEPGYIGKVKTRNRIIKSASGLGTGFGGSIPKEPESGDPTPGDPVPRGMMPEGPEFGGPISKGPPS